MKSLDGLIRQTGEERSMLVEDAASHLEERKENVAAVELIAAHIEALEKFTNNEGIEEAERHYYGELIQMIIEESSENNDEAEKIAADTIGNIDAISIKEINEKIESIIGILGLPITKEQLKKHKASYFKLRHETIRALKAELDISYNSLHKIEESMKMSASFVENTLQPSIRAVRLF